MQDAWKWQEAVGDLLHPRPRQPTPLASAHKHLDAIQRRRSLPMQIIQMLQVQIQKNVLSRALTSTTRFQVPLVVRLLQWFPMLQRIPARLIGLGFRPEHIRTPEFT